MTGTDSGNYLELNQFLRRRKQLGADDPRHGTMNGYSNHFCRCDDCRSAARDYNQRYRKGPEDQAERELRHEMARTHGISSYQKGCRCEDCCRAGRDAKRRWRRARMGIS